MTTTEDTAAVRTLTLLLPAYQTAIGSPESPAAYLRDVVRHNLWWAREQVGRGSTRPAKRMTQSQRREFRLALAFVRAAKGLLRGIAA